MRWVRWTAGLAFGLLLSFAMIWFGPKHTVVCTEAGWPNSLFGDRFLHTDGADFGGCDVPTFGAWIAAGGLLIASTVAIGSIRPKVRS